MIYVKQRIIWLVGLIFLCVGQSQAFFPINIFRPYDINLQFPPPPCTKFILGSWAEAGYKTRGVNRKGFEGDVLTLWNDTQSSIAMLQGFDDNTPATDLLNQIEACAMGQVVDDGRRGHFALTSDLDYNAGFGIWGNYRFPCTNFYLGVYVPFYSMKLKNVVFRDLTADNAMSNQDVCVKTNLTDNFFDVVHTQLDPTLNFTGWDRTGLGDVTVMAQWYQHFPQGKPILKDVGLNVRSGITLPTGLRKNEDDIFSIPFGNDGSAGLFLGAGMYVNWFNLFRFGLDFEFLHQFGNTRRRRIKTDVNQTELLLLAKEKVYIDPGFTQRYDMFFEAYRFLSGLSGRITYQFWQHSEDKLALCSNMYNVEIANSAQSLKRWTHHHFIFKLWYDFTCNMREDAAVIPQIAAFYKLPFNGKRTVLANTAGVMFALNF